MGFGEYDQIKLGQVGFLNAVMNLWLSQKQGIS
jgi:hypothetical protein